MGRTADLGQLGKLGVEVSESTLQNFSMAGVFHSFELLQHPLTRHHDPTPLTLACELGRGKLRFRVEGSD